MRNTGMGNSGKGTTSSVNLECNNHATHNDYIESISNNSRGAHDYSELAIW